MSQVAGVRLGPYEIVGLIGAGGMGEVYRARDTRLGRTVAIKLVQDLSADDHARQRLVREAQHASALNHPNICTIYEIGEANGQPFIAMEYVEGRPLNEATPQDGLPIERVVGFGIQIADAVAHAHDHGIVHRDLKPANVIVTPEGRVKVLDFGLATRTWHEGAADAATAPLTQPGVIAGTIAYMPPEVLQGTLADVRSDIWSLGTMLYELTTGRLPFDGRTAFELSSQILRGPPRPLTGARPGRVVGDDRALPDEGSGTALPASLRGTGRARSEPVGRGSASTATPAAPSPPGRARGAGDDHGPARVPVLVQ